MSSTRPRRRDRYAPALAGALVAMLVVLGGAWLADGFAKRGITARWEAVLGQSVIPVATTVEHRPHFPSDRRVLSRFAQKWNADAHPIPGQLFEFRAHLSTVVHPPRPGLLRLAGTGTKRVRVGGGRGSSEPVLLDGSPQRVDARWEGDLRRDRNELRWELCAEHEPTLCEELPASAFTPAYANPDRTALWLISLLIALGFGLAVALTILAKGTRRRRMISGTAFVLILCAGLGLRLFDYDVMPDMRVNGDELFATWNGWQLVEDGSTVGWSLWARTYDDKVQHETISVWGQRWNLIRPYFEHPPLMHSLVGVAAHAGGADHFTHSKLKHTRLVPILLSLVALTLLFLVARKLSPTGPAAHFAALLYATMPTIVLQGRAIKEEALLVPLMLGAVLAFLHWRDTKRLRPLLVAAVCAGLCTVTKIPGFAVVIALGMLVAAEGETKAFWIASTVGIVTSVGLLLGFAAAIDWDVFWFTTSHQARRPMHFNIFSRWFDVTLVNHNVIGRGWMLFLWLASAVAYRRMSRKDRAVWTVPLIVYLLAIAVGAGSWTFGWYAMPLFPWLCLGAGVFLADLWERPGLFGGMIVALLLVMYTLNFTFEPTTMKNPTDWPMLRALILGVVAVIMAPWALVEVWDRPWLRRVARAALVAQMLVFVGVAARFVVTYETGFDTYENFDRDVYFDR